MRHSPLSLFRMLCLLMAVSIWTLASAQTISDSCAAFNGFHFLEEPVDARLTGMGSVGTGLPGTGFSYYNPAQPFLTDSRYLVLEYGGYEAADLRRGRFETVWNIGKWYVGATLGSFTISGIHYADEQGKKTAESFSSQQSILGFAGGYTWDYWSCALLLDGVQDRIGPQSYYALSLNAGFSMWVVPRRLSLGAAVSHFDKQLKLAGDSPGDTTRLAFAYSTGRYGRNNHLGTGPALPFQFRIGWGWQDTLRHIPYTIGLDVVVRDVVRDPIDNGAARKSFYPVGIEVVPFKPLALRFGKRFGYSTERMNLGVGVRVGNYAFDAGFTVPRLVSDTEMKWLMTISSRQ